MIYKGPQYDYPTLSSTTSPDGTRVYETPHGAVPSVTTILSSIPNPELDAWRERVGDEEADRISLEATTIGTYMHNMLEQHVLGTTYVTTDDPLERIAAQMFHYLRLFGFRDIGRIWGVEVALFFENLYAGRTDLVGLYKNNPAIIDYKTSKFVKKPEFLDKYKLQLAAYSLAHENMFGTPIQYGVLLIGVRPNPDFNKKADLQRVIVEPDEMAHYQDKWVEVLETYYAEAA